MENINKIYNRESDRQWSSKVYQTAKLLVVEVLAGTSGVVPLKQILAAMKQRYPEICDDNIKDPVNQKLAYWQHLVSTAISALKKAGKVRRADGGWILATGKYEVQSQEEISPESLELCDQLRDRLIKLEPHQFESVVAKLLKALGMGEISITGRTADGGIDGYGTMPILNIRVAFQAKRYAFQNSVGIELIQRLIGSVISGGYERGMFVTTSSFTAGAREVAERPDSKVVLVDGEKLVDIMIDKGLGIRRIPVFSEELDETFFMEVAA